MSSSAETVANIEELVIQIPVSVPALSLIRFKCVSKHWLGLTSNPDFHRRHTLRNPNPNKVLAFFTSEIQENDFKSIPLSSPSGKPFKALKIDDSVLLDVSKLKILQSCNGLFLCHIPRYPGRTLDDLIQKKSEKKHRPVYVINPTMNEFRVVSSPRVTGKAMDKYFVRYGLAFDPSKSPHYKVVCVSNYVATGPDRYLYRRGHHDIDIYSSETGTWEKHLECSSFTSLFYRHTNPMNFNSRSREAAVYCNGAVHWVTSSSQVGISPIGGGRFKYERERCDVLHYFDIGEERMRLVATPPPLPLCVKNLAGDEFEVLEMDKDYSGWSVKYHVDLNPVVSAFPGQDRDAFVVLGLFEEEGKDDEDSSPDLWLLHMPGKVISYNLRTNSLKRSVQLVDKEHFQASSSERSWLYYDYHPYMDSLAFV